MHRNEIEMATARIDFPIMEDAFRALVNWPAEASIEGLECAGDALEFLREVACCLAEFGDDRIMPKDTFDRICGVLRERALDDTTYAGGAAMVVANIEQFRPAFERTSETTWPTMMADEPFDADVRVWAERAIERAQGDHGKAATIFARMLSTRPELSARAAAVIVRSAARAQIWAANGG